MRSAVTALPIDRRDATGAPAAEAALRVRGLSVSFQSRSGPVPAVRDVDLDVARGELLALLGESGSGKSATARAIMGLHDSSAQVTASSMEIAGRDLLTSSPEEYRRLRGE